MIRTLPVAAAAAVALLVAVVRAETPQESALDRNDLNMNQLRTRLRDHPLEYLRHARADEEDVKFCKAFYQGLSTGSEVHVVSPNVVSIDDSHPNLQELSRCADPAARTDKNYAWNTFAHSSLFGARNFRLYELHASAPVINGKRSARIIYGEPSPDHWRLPNGGFALLDVEACMYRRLTKSVALDSPYAPLGVLNEVVTFRGETFVLQFERRRANQAETSYLTLVELNEQSEHPAVCLFDDAKISPDLREAINRGLK